MNKTVLATGQAPAAIGPYAQGIRCGDTLFLSGQLGLDPATGKLASGVEAQAAQSIANIKAILASQGLTLENVVKTTVLLADIKDFAAVNAVYAEAFSEPYPARSAFEVGNLPTGGLVEIEVVVVA